MVVVNREALAWAGGFFSGEGSTHVHTNHYVRRDGRRRKYLLMSVANTNLAALEKFRAAVGLGKIYLNPQYGRPHQKTQWQWSAKNAETTMAAIGFLWTFLTDEKKDQIRRVQKDCNECRSKFRTGL